MRRSVIGKVSYCGIDKKRRLVAESDVKECWTAPVPLQAAAQHERARVGIDRLAHAAHAAHGQALLMGRCTRGFDDGQAGSKAL